ncbi:MAG: stage II sporulation protein M [Candidatus Micrarchaeota archaeon]
MVVEAFIGPRTAERNPSEIIVLAFIFVSLAIGIVDYLKVEPPGAMLIMFTLIPSIPFILNLFKLEEEEMEHEIVLGSRTIRRHFSVVLVLAAFFIGLTIAYTFWYLFLEQTDPVRGAKFFEPQLNELKRIQSLSNQLSGKFLENGASPLSASASGPTNPFFFILTQNLRVLALVILGSLIYGAGSVFIIIWNASIIGVFIGNVAKKFVFNEAPAFSLIPGISYGILGLIPHGTFEAIAYLVGALAGGILSSALSRKIWGTPEFKPITFDVIKLMGFAVGLVFVGALIESATFP